MKAHFPDKRHLTILGALDPTEARTVKELRTAHPGFPPGARGILPHLVTRGLVAGGPDRWTITDAGMMLLAEHGRG